MCHRDATGRLRWAVVGESITEARAKRRELMTKADKGEQIIASPRLTFGEAAEKWMAERVANKAASTQAGYRNSLDRHLLPRFGGKRLSTITPAEIAALISDLREEGKAEASIVSILIPANRVFEFARRRLHWGGHNPISDLDEEERPHPRSSDPDRRQISSEELDALIAQTEKPWRCLFKVAALTGVRVSELCGLRWQDVRLEVLEDAEIEIAGQVDRRGNYKSLAKSDAGRRTIPISTGLAIILADHRKRAEYSEPSAYVFATGTGRPLSQRNVSRALRAAQIKAHRSDPQTFPELAEDGKPERGALPSMHSFRHLAASRMLRGGASAEEVAAYLGHKDANVTRSVYLHIVKDAERAANLRDWQTREFGSILQEETPEETGAAVSLSSEIVSATPEEIV